MPDTMTTSQNNSQGPQRQRQRQPTQQDLDQQVQDMDARDLKSHRPPKVNICSNMPGEYTKPQFMAAVRAFIAPTFEKGKPVLICDTEASKPSGRGALPELVGGIRTLLRRARSFEDKERFVQQFGHAKEQRDDVSVDEIAGVIQKMLLNTTVDVHEFKPLMTGYDPQDVFEDIFSEASVRALKKDDETPAQFRERMEKNGLPGIMHRMKKRKVSGFEEGEEATVADALALARWGHESSDMLGISDASKEVYKRLQEAIPESLQGAFTYMDRDGHVRELENVPRELERMGVQFNDYLFNSLAFITRDMAMRVHDRYEAVKMRYPPERRWARHAIQLGVGDPKAWHKAHSVLNPFHNAHGDMLAEFRERPDLTVYEKNMTMAAHKGLDDVFAQKGSVYGVGNPQYKFDFLRHMLEEFSFDFRDHEGPRPDFQNETEYQRQTAEKLWARINNQVVRDPETGEIVIGQEHRDANVQDVVVEGLPKLQEATLAYVLRTWGGTDEGAEVSKIRGYDMLIKDAWSAEDLTKAQRRSLVAAVNQSTGKKLKHADEIDREDLDGLSDQQIAAMGMDRETAVNGAAKARLMHDIKRGFYIYSYTLADKVHMLDRLRTDVDLRMRTVFHHQGADQSAYELLHYGMGQLARDPDKRIKVPEGSVTAGDVRTYAYALRDMKGLVGQLFCSTQWRQASSTDTSDPKLAAKRKSAMDDLVISVLTKQQRELIASLVGKDRISREALFHTLKNVEKRFEKDHKDMLAFAIGPSRYDKFHDPSTGALMGSYSSNFVTEALKNSAPSGLPVEEQEYYGRIRMARLLGKYGDRLKALRAPLKNPYAPIGYSLVFGKDTEVERNALINDMAADLFSTDGEFSRIGKAMQQKSFQDYVDSLGSTEENASPEFLAARQMYVFLQNTHARYRGFGELLMESNTYGRQGLAPVNLDASTVFDAITTLDPEKGARIKVQEFTSSEKVRSPRSRAPGLENTTVMNGVSVLDGAWAHEQRAIQILTEDPYSREFILNLARNQSAHREISTALAVGKPLDLREVVGILDRHGVDRRHPAWDEARAAVEEGREVDAGGVESALSNIHGEALRSTARHLGLTDYDMGDLSQWMHYYSNAMLEQADGKMMSAVDDLTKAYSYARKFTSAEDGVNLAVVTLNTRGWAKKDIGEMTPQTNKGAVKKYYQHALDDFTAAWKTSRGEKLTYELNTSRWFIAGSLYWLRQRFVDANRAPVEGENAEAMAGMGVMQSKLSNLSRVSGEDNRKWFIGVGIGAPLLGAAVAAPIAGLAVGAASLGFTWASERLRLGEKWTNEATAAMEERPEGGRGYIRTYEDRVVKYARAESLVNSGDRSLFRFFRGNFATFRWDAGAMRRYDQAARTLDPLTHNHIVHAHHVRIVEDQDPALQLDLYYDSYLVRLLKRQALERQGRYYEAAWGALDNRLDDMTVNRTTELYDIAHRNNSIQPNLWGRALSLVTLGGLSKYTGRRAAVSMLLNRIGSQPDEADEASPAFDNRSAVLLRQLGYGDRAKELWEAARDKWEPAFQNDKNILKSDSLRGLLTNASHYLNGEAPTWEFR